MYRRRLLALGAAATVAGCSGSIGGEQRRRLDLTVQNDRDDAITVRIEAVDAEGFNFEFEEARIDGGVVETFDIFVGSTGRYETTVTGDDFRGQLAWNAGTCALFDGAVRVTDERVNVSGECVQQRYVPGVPGSHDRRIDYRV